jgi:hypothetical protein
VVPNITATATSSTTCPGGAVTETQSPTAGSPLQNGANTITVTATDQCGNTKTCTTVITYINNLSVEEVDAFSKVSLYPNPVSGELTIDLSSLATEDISIELYDISGKLLRTVNNENGPVVSLDMSGFAVGMYQVRLLSDRARTTRRISKM